MAGGRPWTDEEDAFLIELIGQGKTNADIYVAWVERYGEGHRSRAAIYKRRADLSVDDGRTFNGKPPIDESLRDYQFLGGSFLFVIGERMIAIDYDRWDQICRDYSEYGSDMSGSEIARKHGLPLPVVRRCLTKYGQYKSSPPNCRERIEEHKEDLAPLISEAIENDEHRFIAQLESQRDREWRKEFVALKKERVAEDRVLEAARQIAAEMAPVVVSGSFEPLPGEPWYGHFPTTDEHIGKRVWGKESFGLDYDTPIGVARLRAHGDSTAAWVASQPGKCLVGYRTLVGDLTHALMGETAHGTKLDQDTRAGKVWTETAEACVYSIAKLAAVCERVVVKGAKGNHDGFLFYVFMEYLRARMATVPNVSVEPTPAAYDTFRVGSALHVLDHGYGVGKLTGWKAKAQAEVVAREIGGADFHGADMIYTYVGHLHEDEKGSHGAHLQLRRLPSLGESDDYETGLRYASTPTAHLFRLNERGLIDTEKVLYRADLTAAA